MLFTVNDDTFLDPDVLNPGSVLGVPGLIRALGELERYQLPTLREAESLTIKSCMPLFRRSFDTTLMKSRCLIIFRLMSVQIPSSGPMCLII